MRDVGDVEVKVVSNSRSPPVLLAFFGIGDGSKHRSPIEEIFNVCLVPEVVDLALLISEGGRVTARNEEAGDEVLPKLVGPILYVGLVVGSRGRAVDHGGCCLKVSLRTSPDVHDVG